MVGAGAIAGTLSGGYTNAARSPDVVPAEVAIDRSPAVAQAASVAPAGHTVRATAVAHDADRHERGRPRSAAPAPEAAPMSRRRPR